MKSRHTTSSTTEIFKEYLQSGEEIVWSGQPVPGRFVRAAMGPSVFMLPLMLLFMTIFAINWLTAAHDLPMKWFVLFPPAMIIFGFVTMISRFRKVAKNTFYAVTNRRILVATIRWNGNVWLRDYGRGTVEFLHVAVKADQCGHIIFARGFDNRFGRSNQGTLRGFIAIHDVRRVAGIISGQEYAPPPSATAPWYVKLLTMF